jgi:hypothetical protein
MNKLKRFNKLLMFLTTIFFLVSGIFAQASQAPATLDTAMRTEVINRLLQRLDALYVFPETAKKMETLIRDRVAKKEYDSITSPAAFSQKLTEDLQSISRDKHLQVIFDPKGFPNREDARMTEKEFEEFRQFAARTNFGFERVERLQGNIGYIDIRRFFFAGMIGDTIAAAMNFVANTDALIIDLRNHGGGEPETVALLDSYFFGEMTEVNSVFWRQGNRTQQFWTNPHVAGALYLNKPVYLLTSKFTFSGAEAFAYDLKHLKRATLIGENTGGGANPAPVYRLTDYFGSQIPIAKAVNPITKTNWEGTGITPDVSVPAEQALKTAHIAAVREIMNKQQNPVVKNMLNNLLEKLQKEK